MTRKFADLRAQMSPESQARAKVRAQALLAEMPLNELNPVRAGMVQHPAEYRWSSYRANAQGESDILIQPHSVYGALGAEAVV
jgi:hypothetical protein